jgi:hypothetical protein
VISDLNKTSDREQLALGMANRMGNEQLAQRLDKSSGQKVEFAGVRGLRAVIEKEIFLVQQGEELSYNAALLKVAREQPDLFLTMARLELGGFKSDESVYFDLQDGMLVNPRVMRDGRFVFLDSPLDVRALPAGSSAAQEIALRVAQKMQKSLTASGRSPMSYGDALRLVASECPRLARESAGRVPSGE